MADYDLFTVGGQSNAVGKGDSTASPDPNAGTAIEYDADANTIQDPLDDPTSHNGEDSDTGSAWPKFCVDYVSHTTRNIAIVGAAVSGAAQYPAADVGAGNYDSGSLDEDLIAFTNEAITELQNAGHTVSYQGILWHQGERDAKTIDDGNMTKTDYKTAFENMIERYRTEFGNDMPMWVFQVGHETTAGVGDTVGFQEVRAAQEEVVLAQDNTYLVSDKQKDFPEQGYMSDQLHYNQTGYNIMGEVGALNVAARIDPSSIFMKLKRGTQPSVDGYTGVAGEGVVNTTDYRLVVQDGTTQGGNPIAKEGEL